MSTSQVGPEINELEQMLRVALECALDPLTVLQHDRRLLGQLCVAGRIVVSDVRIHQLSKASSQSFDLRQNEQFDLANPFVSLF